MSGVLPDPTPILARTKTLRGLHFMLRVWKARRIARRRKRNQLARAVVRGRATTAQLNTWERKARQADQTIVRINEAIAWKRMPMRLRALAVARACVGIREEGGNNSGRQVMAIIRANGGTGPEPWCGDGAAYCYRVAGSKAVTRLWAAVRYIGRLSGMVLRPSTRAGQAGDLVCFDFDHVAILVGYCTAEGNPTRRESASHVHTIDFNSTGDDVSDDASTVGGVGEQIRELSQVARMVRVTR